MTPQHFSAAIRLTSVPRHEAAAAPTAIMTPKSGYITANTSPLMDILAAPGTGVIPFDDGRGAVIGVLFERKGRKRLETLPESVFAEIRASGGQKLIKDYWGSYVALWEDPEAGLVHVLRDPSATLPCYYLTGADVVFIASDARALFAMHGADPAIDWPYLAQHLLAIQYRPSRTGLVGLTELLGGYRLTIDQQRQVLEQLWSPWAFGDRKALIADERVAATRVLETTEQVIQAWASCFNQILLGLSGGLDSSIVAACLASSNTPFSCLTISASAQAGDERIYARAMAGAIDAPLFEEGFALRQVDIGTSFVAHLPRPVGRAFGQAVDRISMDVAQAIGADGFFHGAGGDNVFCYLQSVTPILDSFFTHGPGPRTLQTLGDICRLTGSDVWHVLSRAIRRALADRRSYRWPIDSRLLKPDAIQAALLRFDHPWLETPPDALPGTAAHIAMLMAIQNYLEGYLRETMSPVIAPLMSQPLVELCLSIPSWMWCRDGVNRAVARNAFADRLPETIIRRRSKGTPDSFAVEIFEANRKGIRALLADGLLAKHGIIDFDAVVRILDDVRPVRDEAYSRILTFCDFETWARSWYEVSVSAGRLF